MSSPQFSSEGRGWGTEPPETFCGFRGYFAKKHRNWKFSGGEAPRENFYRKHVGILFFQMFDFLLSNMTHDDASDPGGADLKIFV